MLTDLECQHNDPPLTILATFTVPAPISVAVRLRRVWYTMSSLRVYGCDLCFGVRLYVYGPSLFAVVVSMPASLKTSSPIKVQS